MLTVFCLHTLQFICSSYNIDIMQIGYNPVATSNAATAQIRLIPAHFLKTAKYGEPSIANRILGEIPNPY